MEYNGHEILDHPIEVYRKHDYKIVRRIGEVGGKVVAGGSSGSRKWIDGVEQRLDNSFAGMVGFVNQSNDLYLHPKTTIAFKNFVKYVGKSEVFGI